jgi:hypothetical protein
VSAEAIIHPEIEDPGVEPPTEEDQEVSVQTHTPLDVTKGGFHAKCHPLIVRAVPPMVVRSKLAGRLRLFIHQWERITNNQEILALVRGWTIPFISPPQQGRVTSSIPREGKEVVIREIQSLLEKGAIRETKHQEGQVLSSLFLREKKDGSQRPILNLKNLNQYVPYEHFKMESLKDVKNIIETNDLMVKIDLKDAYFTLPLSPESRKFVRFQWEGKLYEFLCLCFGLGPAPRLFTKLLKVPVSMLRRINIRIIIYLDDMLLFGVSMEEITTARDSTIYLLESLGFVINYQKSVLQPTQNIEFLGVVINSVTMTMSLTEEKIKSLSAGCQEAKEMGSLPLRKLPVF